tara:strand:- start:19502 stop:19651 length:150 start_codon:yes stop_codon:yes gene_type:complete
VDLLDFLLGIIGILFGSWKYVKGSGERSKQLGMILFAFGLIFIVRSFLG